MALRWKKDPAETGLLRIGAGPRGSKLHDGTSIYASVHAHSTRHTGRDGWFWVAKSGSGVPYYNSCNEHGLTEAEAKSAAATYVKKHLAAKKGTP
jgi:hypothetical protein